VEVVRIRDPGITFDFAGLAEFYGMKLAGCSSITVCLGLERCSLLNPCASHPFAWWFVRRVVQFNTAVRSSVRLEKLRADNWIHCKNGTVGPANILDKIFSTGEYFAGSVICGWK
jgi:hypothetical protein